MDAFKANPVAPTLAGVLLVDKPRGLTSHDVVDRLRRVAGTRRIGHAGTLDPMAEGLLVVAIGGATRAVQFLTGLPKEYTGVIKLGAISSTYDAEGSIMAQTQPLPRGRAEVEAAMQRQVGLRTQLAPPYSAVKVRGKKLYEYARQGENVPEKPRRVQIYKFDLIDYGAPEARFFARVGSGTYVRSMAHDLGIQLGCGAFLASLRRESVGGFRVADAAPLGLLVQQPELVRERLLGLAEALAHLPKVTVSAGAEREVLHGRGFTPREIVACDNLPRVAEKLLVVNARGQVLSVAEAEVLGRPDGAAAGAANGDGADPALLYFRPIRVLGAA